MSLIERLLPPYEKMKRAEGNLLTKAMKSSDKKTAATILAGLLRERALLVDETSRPAAITAGGWARGYQTVVDVGDWRALAKKKLEIIDQELKGVEEEFSARGWRFP